MVHQLLLLLVLITTSMPGEDPVDSIKKKITRAEEAHRLELAKAQVDVIKWLEGRDATARKKGDKTTVNLVKLQREKLETEGTIPKPLPVNMSRKIDTARDLLDASYSSLLKEALIAKLDELADEIEDKRVQLAKEQANVNVFKQVMHMVKNMVENGSFEFPEVPNGTDHTPLLNNAWANTGNDVVRFKNAKPIHGEQMLQLGDNVVTQEIDGFVPGERYVVTAYVGTYASLKHPNTVSTVSVSIAGEKESATATATNKGSKSPFVMTGVGSNKWERVTLVFKAIGESHRLTLKIESSTLDGLAVVDQVSILPYLGN